MDLNKYKKWDIYLLVGFILINAVFHIIYPVLTLGTSFNSNISTIFEKIRICLTSTSILLAASGFFIAGQVNNIKSKRFRTSVLRSLTWFVISLFSGVFTVSIIPARLHPDSYLEFKHAALWIWLYVAGPVMFVALLLGIAWFFIMIVLLLNSDKN